MSEDEFPNFWDASNASYDVQFMCRLLTLDFINKNGQKLRICPGDREHPQPHIHVFPDRESELVVPCQKSKCSSAQQPGSDLLTNGLCDNFTLLPCYPLEVWGFPSLYPESESPEPNYFGCL
ncbi:hypothetical protein TNIN_188751 [Trichonephila inaurata madagascariensis]|uniref:Uncharacterized protein n=1 Tax=Trichonephila inaurata madagascariensis TaxID=2747483 RepID=A0A8X6MLP1_9ARAC|nr:hypothetical protein TNIN_24981 [Trichonephila inaurata madagascariensis]GFY79271.1 hypothetical protein TNIN_188751 [Trichonephila inaurata madagascariensis]